MLVYVVNKYLSKFFFEFYIFTVHSVAVSSESPYTKRAICFSMVFNKNNSYFKWDTIWKDNTLIKIFRILKNLSTVFETLCGALAVRFAV